MKTGKLEEAACLLQGDLLPNYYEEWAIIQQHRYNSVREKLDLRPLAVELPLSAEKRP